MERGSFSNSDSVGGAAHKRRDVAKMERTTILDRLKGLKGIGRLGRSLVLKESMAERKEMACSSGRTLLARLGDTAPIGALIRSTFLGDPSYR